jgi:hypothetical protein
MGHACSVDFISKANEAKTRRKLIEFAKQKKGLDVVADKLPKPPRQTEEAIPEPQMPQEPEGSDEPLDEGTCDS